MVRYRRIDVMRDDNGIFLSGWPQLDSSEITATAPAERLREHDGITSHCREFQHSCVLQETTGANGNAIVILTLLLLERAGRQCVGRIQDVAA